MVQEQTANEWFDEMRGNNKLCLALFGKTIASVISRTNPDKEAEVRTLRAALMFRLLPRGARLQLTAVAIATLGDTSVADTTLLLDDTVALASAHGLLTEVGVVLEQMGGETEAEQMRAEALCRWIISGGAYTSRVWASDAR